MEMVLAVGLDEIVHWAVLIQTFKTSLFLTVFLDMSTSTSSPLAQVLHSPHISCAGSSKCWTLQLFVLMRQ